MANGSKRRMGLEKMHLEYCKFRSSVESDGLRVPGRDNQ